MYAPKTIEIATMKQRCMMLYLSAARLCKSAHHDVVSDQIGCGTRCLHLLVQLDSFLYNR
jgi:hypothetical protein